MLTGMDDREVDVRAGELGIADYLVKGQLDARTLERSLRYAIKHQRALRALADSEERYALALAGANDGLWDWDLRTDTIYLSPRYKAMLGYAEDALGNDPHDVARPRPPRRPADRRGRGARPPRGAHGALRGRVPDAHGATAPTAGCSRARWPCAGADGARAAARRARRPTSPSARSPSCSSSTTRCTTR